MQRCTWNSWRPVTTRKTVRQIIKKWKYKTASLLNVNSANVNYNKGLNMHLKLNDHFICESALTLVKITYSLDR